MSKIIKAAVAASILSLGASTVLAQQSGSGTMGQGDTSSQTDMNKKQNGPAAQGEHSQGVGSRAIIGSENQPDPNKAVKPDGSPDLKKLDKQGRGGQTN